MKTIIVAVSIVVVAIIALGIKTILRQPDYWIIHSGAGTDMNALTLGKDKN